MTPTSGIDELISKVQGFPDAAARECALELVQQVMQLHASALERILEIADAAAPHTVELFGADELVSRVLVLHGLHPDDYPTRFARVTDRLRGRLDIEVIEPGPEVVRLRVAGGRPGSRAAARRVIEDAIYEAIPEIGELIIEGAEEERQTGFVSLESLLASQPA